MTRDEFIKALADGHTHYNDAHIKVRTRSGAEYLVHEDQLDVCYGDPANDYVYGSRTNGTVTLKGRRKVDTRDQIKFFLLKNVALVMPELNSVAGVEAHTGTYRR